MDIASGRLRAGVSSKRFTRSGGIWGTNSTRTRAASLAIWNALCRRGVLSLMAVEDDRTEELGRFE